MTERILHFCFQDRLPRQRSRRLLAAKADPDGSDPCSTVSCDETLLYLPEAAAGCPVSSVLEGSDLDDLEGFENRRALDAEGCGRETKRQS